MDTFTSPVIENIVLTTAIINLVGVLFIFFTCRFIPVLRVTKPLMQKSWYNFLYKYHTYVWWLFLPSLAVHVIFAIIHKLAGG